MSLFEIDGVLRLTDGLVGEMQKAAFAFLAALGVLAFCFASIRGAIARSFDEPIAVVVRLVLIAAVLGGYDEIVGTVVGASQELAEYFAGQADIDEFSRRVGAQMQPMFEDPAVQQAGSTPEGAPREEPSEIDRLVGWLRGGSLMVATMLACGLQMIAFDCISKLAMVLIALLRILGPLMVAFAVFGDGRTLRQWFSSLIQVALWPAVPPLFMWIVIKTGGPAIESGNVVFAIHQAILLTLLAAGTPFVVSFVMGKGGVGAAAAAVIATGMAAVSTAAGGFKSYQRWKDGAERASGRGDVPGVARPGERHARSDDAAAASSPASRRRGAGTNKPEVAPRGMSRASATPEANPASRQAPEARPAEPMSPVGEPPVVVPAATPLAKAAPAQPSVDARPAPRRESPHQREPSRPRLVARAEREPSSVPRVRSRPEESQS